MNILIAPLRMRIWCESGHSHVYKENNIWVAVCSLTPHCLDESLSGRFCTDEFYERRRRPIYQTTMSSTASLRNKATFIYDSTEGWWQLFNSSFYWTHAFVYLFTSSSNLFIFINFLCNKESNTMIVSFKSNP